MAFLFIQIFKNALYVGVFSGCVMPASERASGEFHTYITGSPLSLTLVGDDKAKLIRKYSLTVIGIMSYIYSQASSYEQTIDRRQTLVVLGQ